MSRTLTIGTNILTRANKSDKQQLHITLTHDRQYLGPAAQARFILNAFNTLRKTIGKANQVRKSFRSILGGAWSLDVKYNRLSKHWNVHLHIFAESEAWSADMLKALTHDWERIAAITYDPDIPRSKDDYSVTVKVIDSPEYQRNASMYVAGLKQGRTIADSLSPELLAQWNKLIKGIRKHGTFGTYRGTPLTARRSSSNADKVQQSTTPSNDAIEQQNASSSDRQNDSDSTITPLECVDDSTTSSEETYERNNQPHDERTIANLRRRVLRRDSRYARTDSRGYPARNDSG